MDSADRKRKWDEPGAASQSPSIAAAGSGSPAAKPDAATSAAAAIAAKIAASINGPAGAKGHELMRLMPGEDGYVRDIPINDLKNRYVLTKGSTQKEASSLTMSRVSTDGRLEMRRVRTCRQRVSGCRMRPSSAREKYRCTSTSSPRRRRR